MNITLILAGGTGRRMNNDLPKQFVEVNGKPLLFYPLTVFNNHKSISKIVVVVHKDYLNEVENYKNSYHLDKIIHIVEGGNSRQESVFNGLSYLKNIVSNDDNILIHDGARVNISEDVIDRCITAMETSNAATTAIKETDTIVLKNQNTISKVLNRDLVYHIQTPQIFKYGVIYSSHLKAREDKLDNFTDDGNLVRHYGHDVTIVNGSKNNIKITTIEDLNYFKFLLKK